MEPGLAVEAFKVEELFLKIHINWLNGVLFRLEVTIKCGIPYAHPCCSFFFFIFFIALISLNLCPVRIRSSFRVSFSSPVSISSRMSRVMCSSANLVPTSFWPRPSSARNSPMLLVSEGIHWSTMFIVIFAKLHCKCVSCTTINNKHVAY